MSLISTWGTRILLAIVAIAAVKIVINSWEHAIADNATAQQNVVTAVQVAKDNDEARKRAEARAAESDRLAADAKKEAQRERVRANKFEGDLRAAGRNEPAVQKWLDEPVPAVVRRLRRARAAGDADSGGVQRPDVAPHANTGAPAAR